MSTIDLFEDGFPHSTREGYDRGCRGGACPGKLENGFSCSEAHVRYAGDYGYRKLVDGGATPAEIAAAEAPAPAPAAPKPMAKQRAETPRPAAAVVERDAVGQALVAAAVVQAEAEKAARVIAEEAVPVDVTPPPAAVAVEAAASRVVEHGTTRGYARGCRTDEACPGGADGRTCRAANAAYQRDYAARRAENGGRPLGSTRGLRKGETVAPAPAVGEPVVEEQLPPSRVVLVPTVDELQSDLAARDARIAELEEQLVAARAAAWSTLIERAGVTGATLLKIEVLS